MAPVILNRLLIVAQSVNSIPHNIDPPLSRLHSKKRDNTRTSRVKVEVWVDPFAAIIEAVPLVLDQVVDLSVA